MTLTFGLYKSKKGSNLHSQLFEAAKEFMTKTKAEFPKLEKADIEKDRATIFGKEAVISVLDGTGFHALVGWRGKTEDGLRRFDGYLNGLLALWNTKLGAAGVPDVTMDLVMSLTMPTRAFPLKGFINDAALASLNKRTKINFSTGGTILRFELEDWESSIALSLAPKSIRTQLITHRHFKQGFPFDYLQNIYKQAWRIVESLRS